MAQLGFGLNTNNTAQTNGYDQYKTSFGRTIGAVASETWTLNPYQLVDKYFEMENAAKDAKLANQEPVPRDALNQKYSDLGLFFEDDEYQSVVDIMVEAKEKERQRQSIIARGPQGAGVTAAKFATGLAVSVFDPINIASAFIPVFGQARFASLAARQGFTRARLARGMVEGAVGAAVVEPLVYNIAQKVQADYTLADSFFNITFGSIIGGGLHVGAGKLKDMKTARDFKARVRKAREKGELIGDQEPELNLYREYYPENSAIMRDLERTHPQTRKLLLQKAMGDMLLERPVDVSPIANQDVVLKDSAGISSGPRVKTNPEQTTDKVDLNTVEQNTVNKQSSDFDVELQTLETQLNNLRVSQVDLEIKVSDDIKTSIEELDEISTREKDLDVIIKDAINCVNGR